MNLLDKIAAYILFLSSAKHEHFFALNIDFHKVEAGVWAIEGKKLKLFNSASIAYEGESELIAACTQALDQALVDLENEPKKILFGVPDSWLQDDNLKEEYTKALQHLVKELGVEPMAYVSISYALSHLLQKQHGVPQTGILIRMDDPLTVTVVKAGKIVGSKTHTRSANLPEDIERSLLSLPDIEVLPSRMILYGPQAFKEQLSKYKDELQSYTWMSNLPFLHLPKIETLDENIEIISTCLAGASEIDPNIHFSAHDLEAILKKQSNLTLNRGNILDPLRGDLQAQGEEIDFRQADMEDENLNQREEFDQLNEAGENSLQSYDKDLVTQNNNFLGFLSSLPGYLKGGWPGKRKLFIFSNKIVLLLIFILVCLVASYIFLPKAKITIFIDPKVLEKEIQITADPKISEIDIDGKKIPAKIIETELASSEKGPTTGKKQIGDPAKGKAVIYNKTSLSKTFSSGIILISSLNKSYKLDSDVSVASQSAVEGGISFGKAIVALTASEIGPDSNLPAGRDLNIKNEQTSNFSAKVDEDISGGTSKEVLVVTSDDQKKLQALGLANLRKQAKDKLQEKLNDPDYRILEGALVEEVKRAQFSKNVGDTTSELTINLTVKFKGSAYLDSHLKTIVSKLISDSIQGNFELNLAESETQVDILKVEKDNKLIFNAKFKANLIPKLNISNIKSQVRGKSPSEVAQIVRKYENVVGSQVKTSTILPSSLQRMPILTNNIEIEIKPK